jgi:MinD-like ATPase involved in chromosome partitioning or flagellar assembly
MTEPSSHEPHPTDTSDRLYTPEELDAFARQQAAATPEPVQGDPLTDPLGDALGDPPAAPAPAGPPPSRPPTDALPTASRPLYRPATPPPSGPPPASPPTRPPAAPSAAAPLAAAPPAAAPAGPPTGPPPAGPPPAAPPAGRRVAGAPDDPALQADPAADVRRFMTATDFLDRRDSDLELGPASWGWRGRVRRWSGNLIKPAMSPREEAFHLDRAAIQRDFDGPRTIAFVNPKGGAAKTTGVLAAGYTFGTVRGGGVVAWDNNETRGTLGIRGTRSSHRNTTRELLEDLGRFKDVYQSRIGDLGAFVRSQGDAHFDVLASDERPDVTGTIRADDFKEVHALLERFYRVILVDTGNNMRAENWLAAAEAADLIVVTSTVREDTGYSGLWMLDALQDAGMTDLKHSCVTVLSDPSPRVDEKLAADLVAVYEQRTRGVYRVPYDPALVSGSVVPYAELSEHTRRSWLAACAGMSSAL